MFGGKGREKMGLARETEEKMIEIAKNAAYIIKKRLVLHDFLQSEGI